METIYKKDNQGAAIRIESNIYKRKYGVKDLVKKYSPDPNQFRNQENKFKLITKNSLKRKISNRNLRNQSSKSIDKNSEDLLKKRIKKKVNKQKKKGLKTEIEFMENNNFFSFVPGSTHNKNEKMALRSSLNNTPIAPSYSKIGKIHKKKI